MTYTMKEVLEFVRENDVKFIRLAFCDLFGTQKNISIMPDELERAFECGISFDASAIKGFSDVSKSDLFLYPDPTTLSVLPWRPSQGRVVRFFCDIKNPDGSPFSCDTRNLVKMAIKRCNDMGYVCKIGSECEFYLFKTDENGNPTNETLDKGGYLDITPLDKGENVRREICLSLEEMSIKPEASHHEQGPGQNEIDFKYSDVLSAADNFITFKAVVKAIAARNGLFASFMPKPLLNHSGSGLHINISLSKNGLNIFEFGNKEFPNIAESFVAGVLDKITEMTAFLNPITNSYDRFGSHEAPKYISWSHQNRSQLIRIPAATGEKTRMELRSPDPSLNPYIGFALILHAGLDGIENGLKLSEPLNINLYTAPEEALSDIKVLPQNLIAALKLAKQSCFVKNIVGDEILNKFIASKESECVDLSLSSEMEAFNKETFNRDRYFSLL